MICLPAIITDFIKARRGVSAIEFALVFPVLIILMLAGIQVITYINAVRRVELVATSISQMLSQAVPPGNSTTATVNYVDLHFAYDATLVIFPYIMKDAARKNIAWWQDITIDFAEIKFIPNGKSCGTSVDQSPCFTGQVAWTSTGTVGGNYRPCGVAQSAVDSSASPTKSTLPRALFGPGAVIAVDVVFTFAPTFGAKFLPSINIARSVFVQPRYATYVDYNTTNNDGIAISCLI